MCLKCALHKAVEGIQGAPQVCIFCLQDLDRATLLANYERLKQQGRFDNIDRVQ